MSIISLSKPLKEVLPDEIEGYRIKPDFRNILRIFRLLSDPDVSQPMKISLLCEFFYVDEVPEDEAVELFIRFVAPNRKEDEPHEEARMDFEFDADEIYSDFLREYHIDLYEENIHWYKFKALMAGLSAGCALYEKIQIRFMDLKNYKGADAERMYKAKENAQIPVKLSAEELKAEAEFVDIWSKVGI